MMTHSTGNTQMAASTASNVWTRILVRRRAAFALLYRFIA